MAIIQREEGANSKTYGTDKLHARGPPCDGLVSHPREE